MGAVRRTEKSRERADRSEKLLRRIEEFLALPHPPIEPFTFRLPKDKERDPFFSGSRTFWNGCVLPSRNKGQPRVQSVVIADPHNKRGVRFIFFASARAYFERLAREQLGHSSEGGKDEN
jgi:hypothetical protein